MAPIIADRVPAGTLFAVETRNAGRAGPRAVGILDRPLQLVFATVKGAFSILALKHRRLGRVVRMTF